MRRENGTAMLEFVWLSVLLLVPFVYGVLCLFEVQRAAFGVAVASRSAARAYLLSPDTVAAGRRASRAADVALADQRVHGATLRVACVPRRACLQPESSVRVVVRASVPLPLLGGGRWGSISVDSTHVESFGRFRAGER